MRLQVFSRIDPSTVIHAVTHLTHPSAIGGGRVDDTSIGGREDCRETSPQRSPRGVWPTERGAGVPRRDRRPQRGFTGPVQSKISRRGLTIPPSSRSPPWVSIQEDTGRAGSMPPIPVPSRRGRWHPSGGCRHDSDDTDSVSDSVP